MGPLPRILQVASIPRVFFSLFCSLLFAHPASSFTKNVLPDILAMTGQSLGPGRAPWGPEQEAAKWKQYFSIQGREGTEVK